MTTGLENKSGGELDALAFMSYAMMDALRASKQPMAARVSRMKTYPITDHVPESELLAITQAGVERWLTTHGWTREGLEWRCVLSAFPKQGNGDPVGQLAYAVEVIAFRSSRSPRAIIAEMQADSRMKKDPT